jgi:serine protease Do
LQHHPSAGARLRRTALAAALALSFGSGLAEAVQARAAPDSFADLAERLSPAVVNISTTQKVETAQGGPGNQFDFQFPPGSPFEEFFKEFLERNRPGPDGQPNRRGPSSRRVTSLGSGFIIDAAGLVVTNNHVIADADEVSVTLHDGSKLDAEVIGKDPKTDLALLRVKPSKPLPAVQFGDSDRLRVGDWVLAIGNPFGLGGTVTAGIVSARSRDINAGPYDDFIQTDASINRGNSGGPLFDMDGRVVGINTAIFSPSGGSIGIGFAIPATLAKNVIDQIGKYGKPRRGWLGVRIQSVTEELAEGLGLSTAQGALVAGVTDNGPAAKSGLQQGDVIVRFDGKDVTEMRSLPRIVAETEIGKEVPVTVWRKDKQENFKVKIGEMDDAEVEKLASAGDTKAPVTGKTVDALGMKLSAITPELRQRFELKEDAAGVIVTDVAADSPAAEKGIRAGDVIVEVAQEEVKSPDQVMEKIGKVKESKRKSVLLLLERGADLRFVAVKLDQG